MTDFQRYRDEMGLPARTGGPSRSKRTTTRAPSEADQWDMSEYFYTEDGALWYVVWGDPSGWPYYQNDATGHTQWEDPRK